jgi:hypothetical protein
VKEEARQNQMSEQNQIATTNDLQGSQITTRTRFNPTSEMQAALKAFQDADYGCTVEEGMTAAGMSRRTFYDWHEMQEGFSVWWNDRAEAHFAKRLPKIMKNLTRASEGEYSRADKKADAALIRLFLERFDKGFVPRSRQEITGKDGEELPVTVTFDLGKTKAMEQASRP